MQDNDRPGALSAVRAFGVMAGGTFVPNLAAAVSVSSVARSVAHRRRPGVAATIGTTAGGLYFAAVRPWMRRRGATKDVRLNGRCRAMSSLRTHLGPSSRGRSRSMLRSTMSGPGSPKSAITPCQRPIHSFGRLGISNRPPLTVIAIGVCRGWHSWDRLGVLLTSRRLLLSVCVRPVCVHRG